MRGSADQGLHCPPATAAGAMGRRACLAGLSAAVACGIATPAAAEAPRSLRLRNVHTGETFDDVYHDGAGYVAEMGERLNLLLRDHHADAAVYMDVRLFDILWRLQQRYLRARGHVPMLNIHSGYRTPETNARLVSEGAALNSYHLRGQAADISVEGYGIHILANLSRGIGQGGWGIYWRGRFVHLDTGPARFWYRR